jgi:imidazolonepropionase-like amidohydrolase
MTQDTRILHVRGVYNSRSRAYGGTALVIAGETIAAVGDGERLAAQWPGISGEDWRDCWLLPGLINTHAHLEFEAGPDTLAAYQADTPAVNLLRAARHAEIMLCSGVTTVRDAGSSWRLLALNRPEVRGFMRLPRLRLAGPPVTVTGGHLYYMGGEADSPGELVKAVRGRHKRGCRDLKLVLSGGQLTPGSLPERESYEPAAVTLAVAEAHRLGMTTFAHCLTTASMVNALRAGVDSIEHGACFVRRADNGLLERVFRPEALEEFRGTGRFFMMGIANNYHALDQWRGNPAAAGERERFLLEQEERECVIFRRYVDLGLTPVAGTDAGCGLTPFDETWLECAILVERCGLSPAEALETATLNGARCLGLEAETGALEPGLCADILAFREDPLQDIRALRKPAHVICQGKIVS